MTVESARALVERLTLLVPDFPTPGVLFRDLTPVFADPAGLHAVIDDLVAPFEGDFDAIAGIEARGFLLASAAAYATGVGAITIRKAGKLPGRVIGTEYTLEYGTARLEMHPDSTHNAQRVLIVDDVLATGGTLGAAARLVESTGAAVTGMSVVMELDDLGGRAALSGRRLHSTVAVHDAG